MTQPIRKPRRNGTPLTEAEIKALDNSTINALIVECFSLPKQYDDIRLWTHPVDYTADVAAAFTIDRPDWRWIHDELDRRGNQWFFDVTAYQYPDNLPHNTDTVKSGYFSTTLTTKPTPADHAKARCIAALLLAAKIGE